VVDGVVPVEPAGSDVAGPAAVVEDRPGTTIGEMTGRGSASDRATANPPTAAVATPATAMATSRTRIGLSRLLRPAPTVGTG